ncbi:hypothetical protein PC117_g11201 [Phytophthora cactorum]|uniref:Uncharacterized protein n=1 Tax=Phytophthora cactorum TaxID=29920 RepID=A0A8T1DFK0_9STRA|nr:hypothetical protein PC117_g11201 [Phytophthora cactorum]
MMQQHQEGILTTGTSSTNEAGAPKAASRVLDRVRLSKSGRPTSPSIRSVNRNAGGSASTSTR